MLVAGNWKMNMHQETIKAFVKAMPKNPDWAADVLVCPPHIYLSSLSEWLDKREIPILTGGQNCHSKENGAYTGEISAAMLKDCGASYVILGHSERRMYFAETDAQVLEKIYSALRHGLSPIYCCGETLDERESNRHFDTIQNQLSESVLHLKADELSKIIIAYEPVWAIGTGRTASTDQAQEMHAFIRDCLRKLFGDDLAKDVKILYGGSCNPSNAAALFGLPDIDGGLIGGASLKANDFLAIIDAANTIIGGK